MIDTRYTTEKIDLISICTFRVQPGMWCELIAWHNEEYNYPLQYLKIRIAPTHSVVGCGAYDDLKCALLEENFQTKLSRFLILVQIVHCHATRISKSLPSDQKWMHSREGEFSRCGNRNIFFSIRKYPTWKDGVACKTSSAFHFTKIYKTCYPEQSGSLSVWRKLGKSALRWRLWVI